MAKTGSERVKKHRRKRAAEMHHEPLAREFIETFWGEGVGFNFVDIPASHPELSEGENGLAVRVSYPVELMPAMVSWAADRGMTFEELMERLQAYIAWRVRGDGVRLIAEGPLGVEYPHRGG